MNVIIGSDHAGWNLKQFIKEVLSEKGHNVIDAGPEGRESCDYSQYALVVARSVARGDYERGILICGTGLGMSMAANRVSDIRASLCTTEYQARMSRSHNNSNILCLGEWVTGKGLALEILDVWLKTEFQGGRHQRRLDIFNQIS